MSENIAAISTAPGTGGVAIIRISGDNPQIIADAMFKTSSGKKPGEFEPYRMYVGEICAGDFCDNGICVFFKAPKSFTGENVIELHCHGGVAVTRGVLARALELGARPATKGEFTRRAFLNGKLSLSSCEGLIDMINSESVAQIKSGYYLFREKLKNSICELQSELTDVLAEIDANIDYPEEGLIEQSGESVKQRLITVKGELDKLIRSYSSGRLISDGVKVAIAGKTNTGKSSLLNELCGEQRAIVTEVEGTTRDVVEGKTEIDGVKFTLYDTAGIRDTDDKVEKIGIGRSMDTINAADLILFVADGSRGLDDEEKSLYASLKDKNVISVLNKSDIAIKSCESAEGERFLGFGDFKPDVVISCKTQNNIDKLRQILRDRGAGGVDINGEYVTQKRHYLALSEAAEALNGAIFAIGVYPLDLVSCDIKASWEKLGEITGTTASEDVIDKIFEKFCVGK